MLLIAILFAPVTFSWSAAIVAALLTTVTLCAGHSVGMHRLLIHRSYECPRWVERILVSLGALVGMGGPKRMMYMHDIRDWSQRQNKCHPFFIHKSSLWKDWLWNLHCEIQLTHPPEFRPPSVVESSRIYRLLDRYWIGIQIPVAFALYSIGGINFVVWGICVRVAMSLTGHWLVGYLAHNVGPRDWHIEGAAVQGYNVHGLGLITFGESFHNNHHAFPESARLGIKSGQCDPGWWLLTVLEGFGLAWNLKQPSDLPERNELRPVHRAAQPQTDTWSKMLPNKTRCNS